jgi:hypothetical protein
MAPSLNPNGALHAPGAGGNEAIPRSKRRRLSRKIKLCQSATSGSSERSPRVQGT